MEEEFSFENQDDGHPVVLQTHSDDGTVGFRITGREAPFLTRDLDTLEAFAKNLLARIEDERG